MLLLGPVLACAGLAAQGPDPASPQQPAAAAAATTPPPPALVRGRLTSRYYLRWTGDDTDNDLLTTLSLDAGDAERHAVSAHFMGRLAYDMDGTDGTFTGLSDTYGQRLDGLVYDAYVDLHRLGGFSLVRIGRQSIYETPEVAFLDGAHVTSAEFGDLAFQVGAYAGASTHLYEASHSGDLIGGVYAQLRPWRRGRFRLDYMHIEEDGRLLGQGDDLVAAGFWQDLGEHLQTELQYSRIGDRDRDARARATWRQSDWGLLLQASYYALLRSQGDLVLEADPFFNSLNELRPYDQVSVLAAKDVSQLVQLQAATDLRRVRDRSDVGFYNRDYDHYYGTVNLHDWGPKGLTLSGTGDLWNSDGQLVRSWGGDATYELGKSTVSIGTYYSLYKFDLFTNSERDHVRTWYGKLRHRTSDAVTLEGDFEVEDDDIDQYYRLRLGVTWRF
ncbi:MAG: hypothetical protein JNM25_08395 [Planctomycetes bacterium]|nr:hypothetical protein [Planctomycetota bacterium]